MVRHETVSGIPPKLFVDMACFFSYVLSRDYGFAPNPFNGVCTLATCKPRIRKAASVGDWVLGTSSIAGGKPSKLIYAMKVSEKMSFNEYWGSPRFETKKPVMNGSLKKMYGDNIYHYNGTEWIQVDSHHSSKDGSPNPYNVKRDTSVDAVLLAKEFYYFGRQCLSLPEKFIPHVAKKGPGYRCLETTWGNILIAYISKNYRPGYHGDPSLFTRFDRYDGVS